MNEQQERERFEHWFSDEGVSPKSIERSPSGEYILMAAKNAWWVWQACASQDHISQLGKMVDTQRSATVSSDDAFRMQWQKITDDGYNNTQKAAMASWNAALQYAATQKPDSRHLSDEDIAKLICLHSGKRVSLTVSDIFERIDFARAVLQYVATQRKENEDEDYHVIMSLSKILAEIAIALKGEELLLHRHGYHDLVELTQKNVL